MVHFFLNAIILWEDVDKVKETCAASGSKKISWGSINFLTLQLKGVSVLEKVKNHWSKRSSPTNVHSRSTFFDDERAVLGLCGTFTETAHVLGVDPEVVLVADHQVRDGDARAVVVLNARVPLLSSTSDDVSR